MKQKILPILIMMAIGVIIITPMLLNNGIITTIRGGSDMGAHLAFVKDLDSGENVKPLYWGQYAIGFILKPFADSEYLDTIYLWFNFIILLCASGTLYFVIRRIFNIPSALLVIPIAMFCTSGIISLFQYGIIFNIINMYIILPFAVYFTVNWLDKWRLIDAISAVALFALYSIFHTTGLYLLWGVGLALLIGIVYCVVQKTPHYLKRIIPFGVIIVALSIATPLIFSNILGMTQGSIIGGINFNFDNLTYLISILVSHLSIATIIIIMLAFILIYTQRAISLLEKRHRLFLFVIGCFVVAIFGGLLLNITSKVQTLYALDASIAMNRLMIDATTLIAIGMACIIGTILANSKSIILKGITSVIVIGGCIPALIMWI